MGQVRPLVVLAADDPGQRRVERDGQRVEDVSGQSGERREGAVANSPEVTAKFVRAFVKLRTEVIKVMRLQPLIKVK